MRSPYLITEPTCISFSGGRTSAYMLYKILEANNGLPDMAKVCFANTGKEEEATLKFVKDCSDNWNVPITWLEYRPDEPKFAVVDFDSASRDGEPFEMLIRSKGYLPNAVSRFCSIELKIRTITKYCKSLGMDITENDAWVGIRADEQRRAAKIERSRTPLVSDGVTKEIVGKFWDQSNFDLGLDGVNGVTKHGNCDLCFLKNSIPSLIQEKPSRAIWWSKMESLAEELGATSTGMLFRIDRPSYAQMLKYTKDQMPLFSDESISCFCGD